MILADVFPYVSVVAVLCWCIASVCALRGKSIIKAIAWSVLGIVFFAALIAWLWIATQRPPLRTMGEVRLWYSLFLVLIGLLVYVRTHWRWLPPVSTLLASVFVVISLCRPELFETDLMPALQSPWFVPHVSIYMFSYSLLSMATIYSSWLLFRRPKREITLRELADERAMVMMGWSLLSIGMITGALWAKQAWGDWWSWDPKETWAAATWMGYLLYIHRSHRGASRVSQFLLLIFSFLLLQMCWYGIKFLPSSAGSIHVYS